MQSGLDKIWPHRKDYSLLPTFGATAGMVEGLPAAFSIYDGRPIPNQNDFDDRFNPPVRPLPLGCTGETTTFIAGLEDTALYPPDDFYFATPPGTDGTGRDIRVALSVAKNRGFKLPDGSIGAKKGNYYNCYGSGAIDDFDAVKIALWINQQEKRGVSVGTWFYREFVNVPESGFTSVPSFNTREGLLHNWLVTGWRDTDWLECLTWQGMNVGNKGIIYIHRTVYNALMQQPYTGAFTLAKTPIAGPVSVGWQAIVDHLVYFVMQKFKLLRSTPVVAPVEPPTPAPEPDPLPPAPAEDALLWDTKEHIRKSIRIMCDKALMSFDEKNVLTACIYQESRFNPKAVGKPNSNGTIDYGLCQYNNGRNPKTNQPYWIGPGAAFASIDEVLNDPEKNVRIMIQMFKAGKANLWSSYKLGHYKQWLTLVQHPLK